jgi:membrane-associated phospholipid phosphatase
MKLSFSPASVVFSVLAILGAFATYVFGWFYGMESVRAHKEFVSQYVYPYLYGTSPMSAGQIEAINNYSNIIDFPWGGVFVIVPLLIAYVYNRWRLALALFVSSAVTMVLAFVLKDITATSRPEVSRLVEEAGYSFPSAHSALVFTTFWSYVLVALFSAKKFVERYVWAVFIFAYGVFVLSIAYTRLFLGVHWLFDILGALSMSLAVAAVAGLVYVKYLKPRDESAIPPVDNQHAVSVPQGATVTESTSQSESSRGVEAQMVQVVSAPAATLVSESNSAPTSAPILGRFK